MPWLLQTSSGKFIDAFGTRGEADTALKKCGIVGARVRPGNIPLVRVLATQTDIPDQYKSVDAFADFLESKKRTNYSAEEFSRLTYYTKQSAKVLRDALTKRGFIEGGRRGASPVATPPRVPKPSGSFKPLPESVEARAKRRTAVPDVNLEDLTSRAVKESLGKLDRNALKLRDDFAAALDHAFVKIQRRVEDYNRTVEQINELMAQLEDGPYFPPGSPPGSKGQKTKRDEIVEAVTHYNEVVEAAKNFVDTLASAADQYQASKSATVPEWDISPEAGAHEEWMDELQAALDSLDEIEEIPLPDPPETVEDEYLIADDDLPEEENAERIRGIPEGP